MLLRAFCQKCETPQNQQTNSAVKPDNSNHLISCACARDFIDVPPRSTPLIQQLHIYDYHDICEQVETMLAIEPTEEKERD